MDGANQLPDYEASSHSSHTAEVEVGRARAAANNAMDEQGRAKGAADAAVGEQGRAKGAADGAVGEQGRAKGAADAAVGEQGRAKGAADAAVVEQGRAKGAADGAVGEQGRAKGAADATVGEQGRAKGAADGAVGEQGRAKDAADAAVGEQSRAEDAADAAVGEQGQAKGAADAAVGEQGRANVAADAAVGEQGRAKGAADTAVDERGRAIQAADTAAQKLQELNKTLENSITATLGGAFQEKSERSRRLDFLWLVVLISGIGGILCIGYSRYEATANLIQERAEISYIALQLLINLASMSGPIWLSWVATIRLARTHAITEDYSYKAALAQAYQGYSTSIATEDEFLKYRLFATVITQLDASPVRFVSEKHPATPFQDLLQQPWMEEALKDEMFKGQLVEWLKSKFKTPFKATSQTEVNK
jgi:hypothetical protein